MHIYIYIYIMIYYSDLKKNGNYHAYCNWDKS